MSQIADIYAAISGWDIDGCKTRNITEVRNTVKSGDVPMRILLPFVEGEQHFVTLGNKTVVEWRIKDLYLHQQTMAGSGIEQCSVDLVEYLANYADNLKSHRSPTVRSHIESISHRMGTFPWGQTDYWGIEFVITVQEEL